MSNYTENPEESLDAPVEVEEVIFAGVEEEIVPAAEEIVLVEEPVAVVEEAPIPAPPAPVKKKHADPVKVELADIENSLPTPAGPAVVSNSEKDTVTASSIIFQNNLSRKSLSVHHLQRRLGELGYADALRDKDGYFGVLTRRALMLFQQQNNLDPDGVASLVTLKKLFTDDPNVDLLP
jgi:hypothetical protein